jgi:alkanesulfonate monooxygenase SsuD/methylene tetrahydromethanopterin reductase-like flavin-dependent oxidoreductase (luciferase family)
MALVELCDELGYRQVRTVEHYFEPYGGFCPSPVVFLTAAAQHSTKARLITRAVLPAFNHPLKLAGELAMLDAFSEGRLEIGFARAFRKALASKGTRTAWCRTGDPPATS